MERLALCSKILYDRDILEKQQQIKRLQDELLSTSTPVVVFEKYSDWLEKLEYIYSNIHRVISTNINDEYGEMMEFGLTSNQLRCFYKIIKKVLYDTTNNKPWSKKIAYNIIESIDCFICSLIDSLLWQTIWSIGQQRLTDLLCSNIRYHLGGEIGVDKSPCILEDIPVFSCSKCKYNVHYFIYNNSICINCQ